MFTTKLLETILILSLVTVCVVFGIQIAKDIYQTGYDNGYEACVEEYNLYLPYDY